jgi:hypothetical protein
MMCWLASQLFVGMRCAMQMPSGISMASTDAEKPTLGNTAAQNLAPDINFPYHCNPQAKSLPEEVSWRE